MAKIYLQTPKGIDLKTLLNSTTDPHLTVLEFEKAISLIKDGLAVGPNEFQGYIFYDSGELPCAKNRVPKNAPSIERYVMSHLLKCFLKIIHQRLRQQIV